MAFRRVDLRGFTLDDDRLNAAVSRVGFGPTAALDARPLLSALRAEVRHRAMSEKCQCTKSLRSSPLRGSKSREAGSQVRGQRWRGGKVNTISSCIVGVQRMIKNSKDHLGGRHPDAASHTDPAITQ
jgi:hypothetical protein